MGECTPPTYPAERFQNCSLEWFVMRVNFMDEEMQLILHWRMMLLWSLVA